MILMYSLLCVILAVFYIVLIHFYTKGWLKTPHQNVKEQFPPSKGLTVIVVIRNEEDHIQACIESMLSQNYPENLYELIVVDDFSTDASASIVQAFGDKVQFIRLAEILGPEYAKLANKKRGITAAVNRAKYDLVLCGDGDCVYGPQWIASMIQYYEKYHKAFFTAPVEYQPGNSIWRKFLSMDQISLMGVTAGSIGQKKPVMANGANMFFEKDVFFEVGGYANNEDIASGDDIFLMQKIFLRDPKAIGFVKNKQAIARTAPPETLREFVHQRIRWTSKSAQMIDPKVKLVLIFNYLFYLSAFLNLFVLPWISGIFFFLGVLMLVLKLFIDTFFFGNMLAFFGRKDLMRWLLPIEIMHLSYVSLLGVLAIFGTYTWKGRRVKR